MGLSITKKLIEAHHGVISVESTLGKLSVTTCMPCGKCEYMLTCEVSLIVTWTKLIYFACIDKHL